MATAPQSFPPGYLEASTAYHIVGTAIAFIVADTLATIIRVCARRIQRNGFMWSDVYMPISLVFNLAVCTCALLGVRYGAGKHLPAVDPNDLKPFSILNYYGMSPVYLCAVVFSKLAILDVYLHIFPQSDKFSRYTSYAMGAIIVASLVGNLIAVLAQCVPIHQLWDPVPGGHCSDIHAHFTWASFPNMITDFIMLILPIPLVIKLKTTWQRKVGVLFTFLVGSFGLVTSILRFIYFYNYGWDNVGSDATWDATPILSWTVVEPGVYHLCACFLTYSSLIRWIIRDSPFSSTLSNLSRLSLLKRSTSSESGSYTRDLKDSATYPSNASQTSYLDRHPSYAFPTGMNVSRVEAGRGVQSMDDRESQIYVETRFDVTETDISIKPKDAHSSSQV